MVLNVFGQTYALQHRRLSYSRHAVNDRDLGTQVNYKMHMNIRRMMGEHKHRHKRSKKLLKVNKVIKEKSKILFFFIKVRALRSIDVIQHTRF